MIDEADRMMDNIKQDWLTQVEQAVYVDQGRRAAPLPLTAAKYVIPLHLTQYTV